VRDFDAKPETLNPKHVTWSVRDFDAAREMENNTWIGERYV
jgi:hypothetical protein